MKILVFDVGKTNLKLSVVAADGRTIETLRAPNRTVIRQGCRVMDLDHAETFLFDGIAALGGRHAITDIITATHGCLAMLLLADGRVELLPDYESTTPDAVAAAYRSLMDDYPARGSAVMGQALHTARQLVWWQTERPEIMAQARYLLLGPQYFAWRLCGVAAAEISMLAALTHLWDAPARRTAPILERQGWTHLIPPLRSAWSDLGPMLPDLVGRLGLAEPPRIRCGVHDSTANFYRYQAAGMRDVTLLSTGTWLVGLSNELPPAEASETDGISLNADIQGAPLACALAMAGREFSILAGAEQSEATADDVRRIVARDIFALPSFVESDGFVPGSAHRGRIVGPQPQAASERRALALLYVALLADCCLDLLGSRASVVVDGSFAGDPLFGRILAALRPAQDVLLCTDNAGTSLGAALVAGHESRIGPKPAEIIRAEALALPVLGDYRAAWRTMCQPASQPFSIRSHDAHVGR